MISTVLANMGDWSDVMLLAVAIGVVVLGWVLARRGSSGRTQTGVLAVLMAGAALAFALVPESGSMSAGPFCSVGDAVPHLGDTANIAMLFPAAFFATIALRAPLPVLAATSGLSAAIELVQASARVLGRACDLNDWYTNTLGAIAGVVIGWVITIAVRRAATGTPDGATASARPPTAPVR